MGQGAALSMILALSLAALIGCEVHEGPTQIVENSFDVRESVWLEVNGFNGSITVNLGEEGQVLVRTSSDNLTASNTQHSRTVAG